MAKRYTYEDAVMAMDMLDELGVEGEARKQAEQEIKDKLGDQKFPESILGLGLGQLDRARDMDDWIEKKEAEEAKKKKAIENMKALHALTNAVTSPEQAAINAGAMYGMKAPISEKEFNAIRAMYGKYGE